MKSLLQIYEEKLIKQLENFGFPDEYIQKIVTPENVTDYFLEGITPSVVAMHFKNGLKHVEN